MYAVGIAKNFWKICDPLPRALRNLAVFTKGGTTMDFGLGLLTFGTLGFVSIFAYLSARAAEKYRDADTPKSALSEDGIAERLAADQS